jgi:hypothetical protein
MDPGDETGEIDDLGEVVGRVGITGLGGLSDGAGHFGDDAVDGAAEDALVELCPDRGGLELVEGAFVLDRLELSGRHRERGDRFVALGVVGAAPVAEIIDDVEALLGDVALGGGGLEPAFALGLGFGLRELGLDDGKIEAEDLLPFHHPVSRFHEHGRDDAALGGGEFDLWIGRR